MLPIAFAVAALSVAFVVALLVRRRSPAVVPDPETEAAAPVDVAPGPVTVAPEPVAVAAEPIAVAPEPPAPRAAVVTEAVPAPARMSGAVEPPRARPVLVPALPIPPVPVLPLPSGPVRSSGDALDTLDALLADLESATVRIDGADALDEGSVAELEGLAARLEAAAESLAAR